MSEEPSEEPSEEEVQLPLLAPTGYVQCPVEGCGEIVKAKGQYTHFRNRHPQLNYADYKAKFLPAPAPAEAEAEKPSGEAPVYKEELNATAVLREVLSRHPDIPKRVVDEVCSWADYGPIHPTQLVSLLSSMRGISQTTAYIVAQKYGLALQKAQAEGKVQLPPVFFGMQVPQQLPPTFLGVQAPQQPGLPMVGMQPTQTPLYQPTTPTAPAPSAPTVTGMPAPTGYPPPPAHAPYVTTEQLEKIMREREEKSELVKLKERMEKMDRDFAGALTSLKEDILKSIEERQPAGVPYEEVKEFIDEEGKVCRPDKAASVRIKRIPITAREPAEVKELREELRDLQKMLQDREISSLREEIKGLKEEIPKRREVEVKPVTPEEVQKAVAEASAKAAQTVLAEVKKEDKEERRHLELLDAIQRSSGAKVVEGYKQDAYRFLGQGMGEVARVIEKKEPIKIIIQGAERLLAGPPPKEVEEGAREGILSRLPPEWVAEE